MQRQGKKSRFFRRTRISSSCFLLPSILGVLLFFLIPFGVVVYYAFVDNPVGGDFVWFENFVKVWNNAAFRQAARNTLMFSAIAVPLTVILSLMLAMILEAKIPMKSQFRTFFLSPMMVPVASVVLIWQVVFHYNGALNSLLSRAVTANAGGKALPCRTGTPLPPSRAAPGSPIGIPAALTRRQIDYITAPCTKRRTLWYN